MSDSNPSNQGRTNGGRLSITDPTALTTAQLFREIENLGAVIRAEVKVIQSQLDGERQIASVRIRATEEQFTAIEAWRKEQKVDTKTAVDAALTAASTAVREQTAAGEKAIAKSEASASEQGKLQAATFAAELKSISIMLSDVKDRVTKIEALKLGAMEVRTTQQSGIGAVVGIIGAVLGVVGLLITVIVLIGAK